MWEEIRLRSLGVIDDASVELDPGLTVVTGETGAGKTMVVTAVGLLCGQRADPGLVRQGSDVGRVEARVDVEALPEVAAAVADCGGDLDEGVLLMARTVAARGRSRAFVGGAAVPAARLERLGERLVAVHGQADQHRLLRSAAQLSALDRFAGPALSALLTDYRQGYARLRALDREIATLRTQASERARELALLEHGLAEIEAAAPRPGEDAALSAEEDRLAHADTLRGAAVQAQALLTGEALATGDAVGGPADAATATSLARARLEDVRTHDPAVARLADRVADLSYQLADAGQELASYADGIDTDPLRLAAVQQRRSLLTDLGRRYGLGPDRSVERVLAWSEQAAVRTAELAGADDRGAALSTERAELLATAHRLTRELGKLRRSAAGRLVERVETELTALAMPHASFDVRVGTRSGADSAHVLGPDGTDADTAQGLGPDGTDEVELWWAANTGLPARPLARSASGGELSRVMLALEVVLAGTTGVPTFVFDEVDAGVGGKAAVEVGRRLARLSRSAQVVAVTHLPQVAAFADRHYRVRKTDDGRVTTSGVHRLDSAGRVTELSRMLAGQEGSATALAHARELLDTAAAER